MKLELPYEYINLLAFESLLMYTNKKSITLDELKLYRKLLIDDVVDTKNKKIDFIDYDSKEKLINFLKDYSDIVYFYNDAIYIKDNVDINNIRQRIEFLENSDENEILSSFKWSSYDSYIISSLGNNLFEKFLDQYTILESKIESIYNKLSNKKDINLEKELSKLLIIKFAMCQYINRLRKHRYEALKSTATERELIFESDYDSPLDEDLWLVYGQDNNELFSLDEDIYSIYQYAIFSNEPLMYKKVSDDISQLYNSKYYNKEEEIDDGEILYELDKSFYEKIFYLKYLDNIQQYLNEYSINLSKAQKHSLNETYYRLLYVLDDYEMCLFKEDSLNEIINYVKDISFDGSILFNIEYEVKFMIYELFNSKKLNNVNKKLIFIKTYYELTYDEELVDMFNNYCDCDNYEIYKSIIFDEKGYNKNLE